MNARLKVQFKTWQRLPKLTAGGRKTCRAQNLASRLAALPPGGARGVGGACRPEARPAAGLPPTLNLVFTTHD